MVNTVRTWPEYKKMLEILREMVNTERTWPEYKKLLEILREMVNTERTWPEYKELLEILREKGVDVDHIIEFLRTWYQLSWRGNIFNVTEFPCILYSHT